MKNGANDKWKMSSALCGHCSPPYNASMAVTGRRKSVIFFITLGSFLVALAIALNVGWILLNWRQVALLVFGIIFFTLIIVGVVLTTIFLIREIRRNEQHDAFINAVTHELKTPLASIRLYLQTLKTRNVKRSGRISMTSCSPTAIDSCIRSSRSCGRDRLVTGGGG